MEKVGTSDSHNLSVVVAQEHICEASRCSSASELSTSSSLSTTEEEDSASSAETFRLTFACRPTISRPSLIWALQGAGIRMKELQMFEKKCLILGVAIIQCCREICNPQKMQLLIQAALQKSRSAKLNLTLYGLQYGGQHTNFLAVRDNENLIFHQQGLIFSHICWRAASFSLGKPSLWHHLAASARHIMMGGW